MQILSQTFLRKSWIKVFSMKFREFAKSGKSEKKSAGSFGNGNRKISGYVIGISDTPKLSPEKIKPVWSVVTQD